jgi:hypothetical protein
LVPEEVIFATTLMHAPIVIGSGNYRNGNLVEAHSAEWLKRWTQGIHIVAVTLLITTSEDTQS